MQCWGANNHGQADALVDRFTAVSAGYSHTCALRESGEIECWGYTYEDQTQPPAGKHTAINVGSRHACALSKDGTATCWMLENRATSVPASLRESTLTAPATGTGGLLNRSAETSRAALAALAAATLSLLALVLLRQSRRRS